jgi:hypothetical protein
LHASEPPSRAVLVTWPCTVVPSVVRTFHAGIGACAPLASRAEVEKRILPSRISGSSGSLAVEPTTAATSGMHSVAHVARVVQLVAGSSSHRKPDGLAATTTTLRARYAATYACAPPGPSVRPLGVVPTPSGTSIIVPGPMAKSRPVETGVSEVASSGSIPSVGTRRTCGASRCGVSGSTSSGCQEQAAPGVTPPGPLRATGPKRLAGLPAAPRAVEKT